MRRIFSRLSDTMPDCARIRLPDATGGGGEAGERCFLGDKTMPCKINFAPQQMQLADDL
jgi:hypothetical protein